MTTTLLRTPTGWAWSGAAAGILGLAGLLATGNLYDPAIGLGDNARLLEAVRGSTTLLLVHQAVCALVTALLVVFGAGLLRHLRAILPPGSLLPGIAAAGVGLTAVTVFVGAGFDTDFWWALTGPLDPATVGGYIVFYNTVPWLWGGLALSSGAVAVAGLRYRAVGGPTAWWSVACTVLLVATQLAPAQYAAVLPGALWLVAGAAFARRRA